jgi:hypothetical protein
MESAASRLGQHVIDRARARVDETRLLTRMVAARCLPSSVDRLRNSEERLSQSLEILLHISASSELEARIA